MVYNFYIITPRILLKDKGLAIEINASGFLALAEVLQIAINWML